MKVKVARTTIQSPEAAAEVFSSVLRMEREIDQDQEHFWVMGLNNKNQVKFLELVSLGGLNSASVYPREVFRLAVVEGVAGIIVGHNHPCDDSTPSAADKTLTERLTAAGEILGIKVLDHVIIGSSVAGTLQWESAQEKGWLK